MVSELRDIGLALIGNSTKDTAKLSVIVPQTVGSGYVQLRPGTAEIKLR